MLNRGSRQRLFAFFWLLWFAVILCIYYQQIWYLLSNKFLPLGLSFLTRVVQQPIVLFGGFGVLLLIALTLSMRTSFVLNWFPKPWLKGGFYPTTLGLVGIIFLFGTAYSTRIWHLFRQGNSVLNFPAFEEALLRFLVAIFGAGLTLLAAIVLGKGICQFLLRWSAADWREGLLYHTGTGLGALAYLSFGLASLHLYSVVNLQILIAVILLSGCMWLSLSWKSSFHQIIEAATNRTDGARHSTKNRVWQVISLLAILTAFVAALAPETEFDALWYHLGFPKMWLERGYLVDLPTEYVSLYPMTWELLFGVGLALGGAIAAKLLHFVCLPLTGLLTYQLTWRFVPRASPWLAVAFLVTIPTVIWEASTTYIDLALALHVGLAVYALLRFTDRHSWQWLVLAAIHLGLALATKHLALFALAIATGGLALYLWLKERNLQKAIVPPFLLGLLSLILPLPWYIRSWLASGNPVFPELFEIFGAPPDRWDAITQRGLDNFLTRFGSPQMNLLALPWDMTIHAARYGGSLGAVFLMLLPVLFLLHRRSRIVPWLIFSVVIYIGLWASPFSSFQMRFLVPISPLLAVLAAEAYARLALPLRAVVINGEKLLYWSFALLLPLNLPPFTPLHEVDRVKWHGWLTHVIRKVPVAVVVGQESQEDYLTKAVPSYAAWRYINAHLPIDARILTFSGGDHFYSQRDRIWSDATIARPAVWGAADGQEQQALQKLQELRISHILFDKQQLQALEPDTLAIAKPSVLHQWYVPEYEDNRFILYRLRWEHLSLKEY
jgi:hypothetical protein